VSDAGQNGPAAGARGPAAARFLDKLSRFAEGLDPEERQALAALIGPGIARATGDTGAQDTGEGDLDEVMGFASSFWLPRSLPEDLAAEISKRAIRIETT
jgi:hypothetical protein